MGVAASKRNASAEEYLGVGIESREGETSFPLTARKVWFDEHNGLLAPTTEQRLSRSISLCRYFSVSQAAAAHPVAAHPDRDKCDEVGVAEGEAKEDVEWPKQNSNLAFRW